MLEQVTALVSSAFSIRQRFSIGLGSGEIPSHVLLFQRPCCSCSEGVAKYTTRYDTCRIFRVLLAPMLGFPGRVRRCTVLLEDWQRHRGHHFLRQNRAGADVPHMAGKLRLLQDLCDIVTCVHRLPLGGHVQIGQHLGSHAPPPHTHTPRS